MKNFNKTSVDNILSNFNKNDISNAFLYSYSLNNGCECQKCNSTINIDV